jgi:TatD DNase family protein
MNTTRPFEVPSIGHPIADTHAHLDMVDDPVGALARAAIAGVALVVTVADPSEDAARTFDEVAAWRGAAAARVERMRTPHGVKRPQRRFDGTRSATCSPQTATKAPNVCVLAGVHPHNAKDFDARARDALLAFVRNPLAVGIGEIGLDYHYDHSPRDVQRKVFAEQLGIAVSMHLPVAIHLREAHDDGERIMREAGLPSEGCVLHCFTGDASLAEPFLELGCYVSFAGPVTFKRADAIREAAAVVPLERLLVETDSPFMTPEPYRGRANEPALTILTAMRIAEIRNMAPADLARATWENSVRLFRPPDRAARGGTEGGEART